MKKKLLVLLLAGVMVCQAAGCTSQEKTETTETTDQAADTDSALGTSTLTEMASYKGLTYTPVDTTVTDEEVESEMQYLVENSTMKKQQDTATETSVVNIDYVGKKDGVAFEGGTAEGQQLDLGNSTYIEGFAESIVGMKVGETKDCPMTFPEDYGVEELNGADVVFTITVNECWENIPAELNDEFAVSQGYENVEALYGGMRQLCEYTKQQNADSSMKTQLIEQLIEGSKFDITEEEIQYYIEEMRAQAEMYANYYGYNLETYITESGLTMEQFEEDCRKDTIYRIQTALLQSEIAKAENIEITDEVYTRKAEEYMTYYGYENLEDFETAYTKEKITSQIISDLVMDVMVANAKAAE